MAAGMLDGLFAPKIRDVRQEEIDEDRRISDLAADPFKAMAMTAYGSARDAGRALGETAASAFGKDPRTPTKRHSDAVEAAKAQVAQLGLNPDDPKSMDEFYRQVIMILQKQGLAAEALAVGKEYQAQKRAAAKGDLEVQELQRKKDRDLATNARAAERNAILAKKGLGTPETLRLLAELDNTPVEQAEKRKAITARLNALAAAGNKGIKIVDLGNEVQIVDAATGKEIRSEDKGAEPAKSATPANTAKEKAAKEAAKDAYVEAKAGLQRQYDAVVALHNHPGVEGITGRIGRKVGEEGFVGETMTTVASGPARAALALHEQVVGGTFLAGLVKLKAASKTGATGLGAVTEKEGNKVQSDAAALNRAQDAPAYRQQLSIYASEMIAFGQRLDAAAQDDGIPPVPLTEKPLQAPQRGRRAADKPAAAAPAAAPAPAAPAAGVVRWVRKDGKLVKEQ